ncbi:PDZ and LIM domain protein Zasp [Dufourea novaeangliae]|uniref:PDZ and LIM domain protein Zasp n=1 Tax=Dufourea novaeangliae TaxID=178035 RepID=A0A154NZJ0_DUFNO|nr:PDZ and LIM domain protein Zasp [Dufourea novaeangliae]
MTRKQTVIVKLKRSTTEKPWGICIAGGADLGTPIVVTRSENEALRRGDVIKKIDEYDVRDVRHVDAQRLLQTSESIKLVVERSEPSCASRINITTTSPPIIGSNVGNRAAVTTESTGGIAEESCTTGNDRGFQPVRITAGSFRVVARTSRRGSRGKGLFPYRTTPLVLPGAKVKKDAPLGECYLRHHPNPMIRAAPHHYEPAHPEVAMKQKVAETVLQRVLGPNEVPKVVHKQFNSPIGLYSEQNIADTIKCQASAIPLKKPGKYDPSKSEAYKALQEEALDDTMPEVKQPARTGVFSPQKVYQNRVHQVRPKSPAPFVTIHDDDGEKIHQSNSFKRIMYSVLGQTDY